ncbi:MAG: ABC transporter ATP-binding protein [Woeseiaceae bacterium]|nr:ABC transporter ATP-binding protein [Woeseiaceae bacterium]
MDHDNILVLDGIAKKFGDIVALEHVDLSIRRGEVHVVCGENGAGKSTLMNILVGIHAPDGGKIVFNGKETTIRDPLAAGAMGIGMVHQHFTLVPSMSVAENLFLGHHLRHFGFFSDRRAMVERAGTLIDTYSFALDPEASVRTLSVGQRQRVEILKALVFDAELLILDEPTAVLTPPEVEELLKVITNLRDRGRTVLFITHKLREVKAVSDRVTILRRGKNISTHITKTVTENDIARDMVGRDVFLMGRQGQGVRAFGKNVLQLENVSITNSNGRLLLDGINLDVRAGEVLGIAGVDGNGQTELAEAIAGLIPVQAGTIRLDGTDINNASVVRRQETGLGFVPEDRLDRGLSRNMSIAENMAATNYLRAGILWRGFVDKGRLAEFTQKGIEQFDIRGAKPSLTVGSLSGGNMQKVVLAREFARDPKVLLVSQPTRGLDIGASEFVYSEILSAADKGNGILLISSELSEIFALADRIAVIYSGRIMQILTREDADEETVGILMNGGKEQAA